MSTPAASPGSAWARVPVGPCGLHSVRTSPGKQRVAFEMKTGASIRFARRL